MSGSLLSIASSGLSASQAGLDVTAQNIANAGTTGYVRQSVAQTELATPQNSGIVGDMAMSGVRVTGINRDVSQFLQSQVMSTGSASARADGLVSNLQNVDNAVEQSNVFGAITQFQSGLQQLSANPTDPSLRASLLADAQGLSQSFNLASTSLGQAAQGMQQDAAQGIAQVNALAQSLASLNQQLATNPAGLTANTTGQNSLLDQRDTLLQQLSQLTDITATFAANGAASVQIGGASGPVLVSGGNAANGTIAFTLSGGAGGASAASIAGGSLAADQQGLVAAANASAQLDGIANALIGAANGAQGSGVDLTGATGQPLFSGSGAGGMAVAITSGNQLATAPAGAGAGSRDYLAERFEASTVLVLGSEGEGLHQKIRERCDALLRIPMPGGTESLNVSASAAVMLFRVLAARA